MTNNKQNFKFLEHTADIKFQAFGKSLNDVFENSALAMFNTMSDKKVKPKIKKKIKVSGKDLENLLYNFLEELLFLLDSKNFFLSKVNKIKIDEKKLILRAEISGDDSKNYEVKIDVKAVTYNEMFVKKVKNKWIAQVVLDV
jgi:SHS2 domain-containing protein